MRRCIQDRSKSQAQQLVDAVAVFNLAARPMHAAAERRGPDRAKNVTRPQFGAKAKAPTLSTEAVPAKTGTDGEWASF